MAGVTLPVMLSAALLLVLAAAQPAPPLAITQVTVVDVETGTHRAGQTVVIRGGRIAAAGPEAATEIPPGARRVDGTGRFLIPGLWDMHVHLTLTGDPGVAEDVVLPALLAYGVVGVREMGGDFARVGKLRTEVAAGRLTGPRIVAAGPFLDGTPETGPMWRPVANPEQSWEAVRELKSRGVDFIKVQAGLSPESWRAIAEECRRIGLPFAGHVPEAVSASEVPGSGQRSIEHVSPALPGDASLMLAGSRREDELRRNVLALGAAIRAPGADATTLRGRRRALQAALVDSYDSARARALFRRLAEAKVAVVPTLVFSQTTLSPTPDLAADLPRDLIPKPLGEAWTAALAEYNKGMAPESRDLARRVAERSREVVSDLRAEGVTLLAGTDSFDAFVLPGFALHQELELLVQSGLPPAEALAAATTSAAAFLGLPDRGTIAPGQAADLVLLAADPLADIRHTRRIEAVIQDGALHTKTDLDALLARVRSAALR